MGRKVLAVGLAAVIGVGGATVLLVQRRRLRGNALPNPLKPGVEAVTVRGMRELEEVAGDTARRGNVAAVELQGTVVPVLPLHHLTVLPNLVRLDVTACGLTELPADISTLKNLQVLLAARNKLAAVPAELGRLTGLVQLDLGANQLAEVPAALCRLTGLRSLNLMGNQLERLPADFGNLRNLRLLGLKSNKLVELPGSFSQLTQLVELFLTDNLLTSLPEGMSRCTSLVKLQASFNKFTSLPACLLHLPRLEMLRVAVCAIGALPPGLLESGALPRLAWFSVAGNPACPDPPAPAPGLPIVHHEDLELGQKLGDGASGEVYRAVWRGDLVAVKFFRADVSPDGRTEDEVALAIALQHPHLTQVLARVEHPKGLVLRLETGTPLALKPTSAHLLRCKWADDVRFAPRRALALALAVADALAYCHAAGICHGDVYAHNVLMDENNTVTLCDFGASFSYAPASQPFWQAMEVRAYGLMLADVAQRSDDAIAAAAAAAAAAGKDTTVASGAAAAAVAALRVLAKRCSDLVPSARPSFAALCDELRELRIKTLGEE